MFDIVYKDSTISDELKFDLIHIMLYFQESSTRQHRGIIFNKIKAGEPIVISNLQFAIPFLFCHYCEKTDVLKIIKQKQNYLQNKILSLYYQKYNQRLWESMNEIDIEKDESSKLNSSVNHSYTIIPVYLLKKYSQLPKSECNPFRLP